MERKQPTTLDEIESRILLLRSEIRTARPANVNWVMHLAKERMETRRKLRDMIQQDLQDVRRCVDNLEPNIEELQLTLAVQRYARKYRIPIDLAFHNVEYLHKRGFEYYEIP